MAGDRAIAALTIAAEASNQTATCRRMVAFSLFNRLRAGRFGKTIAAVCLKRMQYSEWNADAADNANLLRVASMSDVDPLLQDCYAAYDEAATGDAPDPSRGATHFYAMHIPAPSWTAGATCCAQDGSVLFWRDVK